MIPRIVAALLLCVSVRVIAEPGAVDSGWGGGAAPRDSSNRVPAMAAVKPVAADTLRRNLHRADTVLVVKHSHVHREQIVAGSAIMACLVGILVVMNNYNPR